MNRPAISALALAFAMMASPLQASNSASTQNRCNLTEETAPKVRGLHLGMTAQQFVAFFPGITKRKEMNDSIEQAKMVTSEQPTTLGVDPVADGSASQFAGLESAAAVFYKGKAVEVSVQYGGAMWRTVDEWISKLSGTFNLPGAQEWVTGPEEAPNKVLRCNGILIEGAIQGGSASIRIKNTNYVREAEERARAAEEKKRQQVKP